MNTHLKSVKFWIFVVLCSVFVYNLYYLIHGLQFTWWTYTVLGGPSTYYYRTISSIGHTLRFIGLFLAIHAAYNFWGPKPKSFSAIKNKVMAALFLEAAYFITFVPGLLNILDYGSFLPEITFFVSIYFLQMLLNTPLLIILGVKIKNEIDTSLRKWAGIACVGYIASIWINIAFRWFFMSLQEGVQFLLAGTILLGFLPSIITLSLSVIFSIVGIIKLVQNVNKAIRWFGLSAVMLGTHFAIYLIYNAVGGMLDYAILTEVWALSLLGLGVSVLIQKD